MQADAEGVAGLAISTNLSPELIADLALSAGSAVMWSVDFVSGSATWTGGLDTVLGIPGAPDQEVQARLLSLIEPLTVAARSAPIWHYLELEQPCGEPESDPKWVRFRARTLGDHRTEGLLGVAADATDQHEDREALADVVDRYRLLIELSPEAICVHNGIYMIYANPTMVRMLGGRSSMDLVGRPIVDFVESKAMPAVHRRIHSMTHPGAITQPAEAVLKRLDGTTVLVESISVRTTWRGQPAFQVIMRDITVQKAAEEALHYRAALVEHVSDAIIATDSTGKVTNWNPAAEAVYQRTAAEAVGRSVTEMVGATLKPENVLHDGGVVTAIHRRSDGTALDIRISAAKMDDGYVLVCADETARRRAEQHFSIVVAALDEGVLVIGADGSIESANPAAQHILGITAQQLRGNALSMLSLFDEAGAPIPPSENPAAQTLRTGTPQTGRVLQVHRADQRTVWISLTCRPLDPRSGTSSAVIMSFTDITERRTIAARLAHDATHDPLTGLANRTLIIDRLTAALNEPNKTNLISVLFIDLDKFKVINDSLGHSIGDEVLRIMGKRLSVGMRSGDLIGRLGGDEFVAVTFAAQEIEEIGALAIRLRDSLTQPIAIDGKRLHLDASIGVVVADPQDTRRAEDLIRDADVAMYQAKTMGRGRYEFFDVQLRERLQRRQQLEQDLRGALPQQELWIAYQPVVDLSTGQTVATESLLRWQHPKHGVISPMEFIPVAEESDLINIIGDHVLRQTTQEIAARREQHHVDIQLAVNVSTRQLDDPHLVTAVRDALRTSGLPPAALHLEITESALMRDSSATANSLAELRKLGVRLAIDDFGTGYSSLAQLQRLPLDTLKIDRSFVTGLGEQTDAEVIVASIIAMAHAVNLTVVAEGVETEQQREILLRLGCDRGQGFLFGKPSSVDALFPVA